MNKKTLKALEGSILKWDKIVDSTKGIDDGTANCPLCQTFDSCNDCLIDKYSKDSYSAGCGGTPYSKWEDHQKKIHRGKYPPYSRAPKCRTCLKLAKEELNFLCGLLPKKTSK